VSLCLPFLAGVEPLECLDERLTDDQAEPGVEGVRALELTERIGALGENRPGVEAGVHAVERDADLVLALPDRPRDRQGASVPRPKRRVAVEPAGTRHRGAV